MEGNKKRKEVNYAGLESRECVDRLQWLVVSGEEKKEKQNFSGLQFSRRE